MPRTILGRVVAPVAENPQAEDQAGYGGCVHHPEPAEDADEAARFEHDQSVGQERGNHDQGDGQTHVQIGGHDAETGGGESEPGGSLEECREKEGAENEREGERFH